MAGTAAIGGARPSTDGSGKRSAGRYVLGDLLGRGGMAEVFAGHAIGDHGFQKPVAIKRLLPELASDHVFVERLIGEAKLLVGMQHGNIVSVLDLARDGDDVFLVMEFVDGPSLRQLLKSRSRGLSLAVVTYIVQSAAAGLEFAHNRPGGAIIHADISPSNLLLTTSGEVRVADFGIARREGGGHGVVEGKWAYMAPEQARGEPLSARADVFALGVVLYELACGQHPFGRTVTAEERDSEPLRVVPPRVVKPSVPAGLDAICMRALAHDPRDRYKSMQQLIDALVEERFSNHWREGASDLAQAIRECGAEHAVVQQPRTMVTDRPVTIITRSLIRESQGLIDAARGSSSRISSSHSASVSGSMPASISGAPPADAFGMEPSQAATNMLFVEDLARAAALLEIPLNLRADGTPMPPFRMSDPRVPDDELASVVGGSTMTGHVAVEGRSNRWTIAVLGVAAMVGAIAAVALQLRSSPSESPAPAPVAVAPAPAAKPPEPPPAPVDPAPTPTVVKVNDDPPAQPAPEPKPETKPDEPPPPAVKEVDEPAPRNQRARPAVSAKKKEPGSVRVSAYPWAYASVAGQRHDTPYTFKLPPGRYTVKLEYPTLNLSDTRVVVIESNRMSEVRVDKREDD